MLGDFHYKGTKGSYDYTYDPNGNLTFDANRRTDTYVYNYLNLLQSVHMKGEGNIVYTYDAGGNKILKLTTDSTQGLATTTLYLDGFQYQRRAPMATPTTGVDTLQFAGHEEGRARWADHTYLNGTSAYGWEYDFAERDHLGNERVLLTQEKDSGQYMCTLEPQYRATEEALFYNIGPSSYPAASVPGISGGFPAPPNGPATNDTVIRLDGNGPNTGPAIILKVMAGDKVSMGAYYYYVASTANSPTPLTPQNLLNSLASGLASLSSVAGEGVTTLANPTSSPLLAALTSSISNEDVPGTSKPQAYLNWMLLDNQFNLVANTNGNNQNGAQQVGAAGLNGSALQSPLAETITAAKSGYLYIYLSNTTPGWDVFFDNLSVLHYSSPLIEENHYYPYGLTMAGISDKALKGNYAENKYRWNKGSELQNKEFSDGSGLELYETPLRSLDPQLGRWWQIDPAFTNGVDGDDEVNDVIINGLKSQSPYASMDNNPIKLDDPKGDCPPCGLALAVEAAQAGTDIATAGAAATSGSSGSTMGPGEAMVAATGAFFSGAWHGMVKAYDMVFGSSPSSPTATTTPGAPSAPTTTATDGAPSAPTATNPSAPGTAQTQGSGEGRGVNNRKPDPNATGDHTVSNNRGSTTYEKNAKNPTGFQEVKRVDTKGASHGGVQTPHVHEDGKVRPAKPDEIPKTDLSKNKPPQTH